MAESTRVPLGQGEAVITLGQRFKSAEQLCVPCGLSAIHRVNWANQMKCIEPHPRAATGASARPVYTRYKPGNDS